MDDQRRYGQQRKDGPPSEGVRIIGPDEAAEALERDDVAPRRGDDEPRYGDRPEAPPEGSRPSLRFPLDATADPSKIERPPVDPPPDPVTGPVELPHWTEPATGEVPAVLIGDRGPLLDDGDEDDDLDGWSSFTTGPRWRDADDDWGDDDFMTNLSERSQEVRVGALADQDPIEDGWDDTFDEDIDPRGAERTEDAGDWNDRDDWGAADGDAWDDDDSERIVVGGGRNPSDGDDPSGRVDAVDDDHDEAGDSQQVDAVDDGPYTGPVPEYDESGLVPEVDSDGGDRNLPVAVGVGVGLAVVALLAMAIDARLMVIIVAAALGFAAYEFFTQLGRAEWETASLLGIVSCVALPLAAYWRGATAYPLLMFVILAATLCWYLAGAGGRDPRVVEGTGATLLGVVWIGVLGSTAAAMLAVNKGTGLLIAAILATVAYDVGGLFIGRYIGHRPLSAASPNKTVEGLVGGMGLALVITVISIGIVNTGPWTGAGAALVLGLGAACAAPLGDLCQSLIKRDLRIKDMGSILPGHGGVLDRFDSMLFVLPTVFWLTWAFELSA